MNEDQWHSCSTPSPMLEFLRGQGELTERKARLFAVACCRRIWPLLSDARARYAVKVAERFADGAVRPTERNKAERQVQKACRDADPLYPNWGHGENPAELSYLAACATVAVYLSADRRSVHAANFAAYARGLHQTSNSEMVRTSEQHAQCGLLRDLFRIPSRTTPRIEPAWLSWYDGSVVRLAQAAYEERQLPEGTLDNGRLAILADALEEAGCTDAAILDHLRGLGPHVRGCWAVDLVLGRR